MNTMLNPPDQATRCLRHEEPDPARPDTMGQLPVTGAVAEDHTPTPKGRDTRPWWKAAAPVLLFVLLKAKKIVLVVSKFKMIGTLVSMIISIGAYALLWGWQFAVGFVLLLLAHEMGHVIQLRREGVRATAPMFIPFVGALVGMKEMPRDAAAEARVGLAGPVLGTLACLVPLGLYVLSDNPLFLALTYVGSFLNLFNLLPTLPLDGGRAMVAVSPWLWLVGYAGAVAVTILTLNPLMLLILLLGGLELWHRFRKRNQSEGRRYLQVPKKQRALILAAYVLLVAVLGIATEATYLDREELRTITD